MRHVLIGAALVTFSGGAITCATGIEPPAPTAMVDVKTGLTFMFGNNDFCVADNLPFPDCSASTGNIPILWPQVEVALQPFAIDVHEVTNIQYEYCVAAGGCTDPMGFNAVAPDQQFYYEIDQFNDFPVVGITWEQAQSYCAFVDKRLPSEFEWERVAVGESGRNYPSEMLGADIDACQSLDFAAEFCAGDNRVEKAGVSGVDFVQENGQKIFHLMANVAEWTSTTYVEDITCLDDPPCERADECAVGDFACETLAASCTTPGPCTNASANECCNELSSGECHFLCDGQPRKTIVCTGYSAAQEPVAAADLTPTQGNRRVIRGGSVRTATRDTCRFRGDYRDFNAEPVRAEPDIGFRCAKSL